MYFVDKGYLSYLGAWWRYISLQDGADTNQFGKHQVSDDIGMVMKKVIIMFQNIGVFQETG